MAIGTERIAARKELYGIVLAQIPALGMQHDEEIVNQRNWLDLVVKWQQTGTIGWPLPFTVFDFGGQQDSKVQSQAGYLVDMPTSVHYATGFLAGDGTGRAADAVLDEIDSALGALADYLFNVTSATQPVHFGVFDKPVIVTSSQSAINQMCLSYKIPIYVGTLNFTMTMAG